ncbi:MAG: CvfB family protein [Turicibacter sp.]
MLAGQYNKLIVDRQTPLGYSLKDGDEEYFLHEAEVTEELEIGSEVDVFMYYDSKKRLTATMQKPKITTTQFGWVEVVDHKNDLGLFVDIGINKQILIAPSDLPIYQHLWPQVGDFVYCILKESLSNYLFAIVARPSEFGDVVQAAQPSLHGKKIKATVIRTGKIGTNVITEEGYLGFIHESERREEPRLGEVIEGRVVRVKENGELNISLIPQKEISIGDDSTVIYDYLVERNGSMPFTDKSAPEDIKRVFKMSKASFKRALGRLMKEGKAYQDGEWTYLKQEAVEVEAVQEDSVE